MRRILLPALLLLLPGCADSLGIGSGCSEEMRQVRQREGSPDDFQRSTVGGNNTEQWYYFDAGRVYTFRWGVSYESCQVSGPSAFSRDLIRLLRAPHPSTR